MKFSDVFPTFEFDKESGVLEIWMDREVAENLSDEDAIKFSIQKFQRSLAIMKKLDSKDQVTAQYGIFSCPLCEKYINQTDACYGCPIRNKTGQIGCVDTPYDSEIVNAETAEEYIPALKHEIEFLKSLL